MTRLLPFAVAALLVTNVGTAAESQPNVVLILADDLGPGDFSCYGGKLAETPNIDRMAREGTRFTQYYAASPICSPSRCGMITGQYPGRWKITSFLQTRAGNAGCEQADYLDAQAPSLPRALKTAGYATAHFGKWHLGGGRDVADAPPFAAYGYDEHAGTWESPQPHPDITARDWIWSPDDKVKRWNRTAFFIDKTLDFLERHKDHPCFINVWLDDPHTPWVPAENEKGNTPQNVRRVMTEVDRQVGRLLEGVRRLEADRKTLVIFVSDNGPLPAFDRARTVGLRGSKLSLYEGGIRVPFIAWGPAIVPAGRTNDTTVLSGVDLFPTICKLCGAALPHDYTSDGEDLSSALLGEAPQRSKPMFWEYGRNDKFFRYPPARNDRSPNVAVRDKNWKLLINRDGNDAELYDLPRDPNESINVIADHPDVVDRLKTAALNWRESLP
ncbi:MAG: sulfatase-like hydrolase/transferase [Pirellulales bacterium]